MRRSPSLTVVTNSEVQTFRSCAQLHHFTYREKLRPISEAKPLAFGGIFHSGMRAGLLAGWSAGWESAPESKRLALQIAASTAGIDDRVMNWASSVMTTAGSTFDFARLEDEVDQMAKTVKFLLEHYFTATKNDLSSLVLVEVESPFSVPVRNKAGVAQHLRLDGVRDAVFYDPTYNDLVLMEHKTSASAPRDLEKRVEMDPQTTGYTYALREELANGRVKLVDGTVLPPDTLIGRTAYNVLRKSMPREPNVNKDGSVSAAAIDTTADIYRAALKKQVEERKIPTSDKQAELLSRLEGQGDRYFARVEYYRTKGEIERWRSELYVDASRIREADRDPTRRTRNTGHCNNAWSMRCAYRSICMDPGVKELYGQFRRIDDAHAEVREAEVDMEATIGAATTAA